MSRLIDRLRRALLHRRFAWFLAAVAVVVHLPELGTGYLVDDFSHRYFAQGNGFPGGPRGAWDLYRFADGGEGIRQNIASGVFPWYSNPHLKLAFFRPIPSLLRVGEEAAFGNHVILCHALSIALFVVTTLTVLALYRLWIGGAAASLGALLFAVDDAHASTMTWVAARHSLVATLFLTLALLFHLRARAAQRTSIASGLLFFLALSSSESAVSGLAFFGAIALFDDARALGARARSLTPMALATVVWATIYGLLGYGAQGSAFYIDPVRSPLRFGGAAVTRGPILALAQLFMPPSEAASLSPAVALPLAIGAAIFVATFFALSAWRLPNRGLVLSLLVGFALSLVPACGTYCDDRLLMVPGIAAFALLALWARKVAEPNPSLPLRLAAVIGFMVHVVFAAVLLPLRSRLVDSMLGGIVDRGAASIPPGFDVGPAAIVALSSPDGLLPASMVLEHSLVHGTKPKTIHLLGPSPTTPLTVTRTSAAVIEISSEGGMMHDPFIGALRPTMFEPGEKVTTDLFSSEVLSVRQGGFPTAIRFTFHDGTLDAARFLAWEDHRWAEVSLPEVGASIVLPAVDIAKELAMGRDPR